MRTFVSKFLSFLVGLLALPAVIGAVLYFSFGAIIQDSKPDRRSLSATKLKARLSLPNHETLKKIPSPPWKLVVAITEADLSWPATMYQSKSGPLPDVWEVSSLPFEFDAKVFLKGFRTNETSGSALARLKISFVICANSECQQAFHPNLSAFDPMRELQRHPSPHILFGEVIKEFDPVRAETISLGEIFFRAAYEPAQKKIECKTQNLKIRQLGKVLDPKGASFVVRVPTEYAQMINGKKIRTDLLNGNLESIMDIVGQVDLGKAEAQLSAPKTSLSDQYIYTPYFLINCKRDEKRESCLSRFAKQYFGDGQPSSGEEFYPLTPKNNLIPRCDYSEELELFAYRFNATVTSPDQFRPADRGESIPREIIDAPL